MPKMTRKVIYPKYDVQMRIGQRAIKLKEAQELAGWQEDTEDAPFADGEYIEEIVIPSGRRVRMTNNLRNRLINRSHFRELTQEHLMGRWGKGNSTSPDGIGIGETGQIMSGQNRLGSFIVAELTRSADTEEGAEWRKTQPDPLTLNCILVLGMDESDETFRFLNTGLPATVADAVYRGDWFRSKKNTQRDRAKLARSLDSAISTLWERTGHAQMAQGRECTNSEAMEFLERHRKIVDIVQSVHDEYKSASAHASRMGAGQMAALVYLMAVSATPDREKYRKARGDRGCDWSNREKAEEFLMLLCKLDDPNPEFGLLREMMSSLTDANAPLHGTYERKILLTKAWHLFVKGIPFTRKLLNLDYVIQDGIRSLNEFPSICGLAIPEGVTGGIDLNEGRGLASESDEDDPAEIAERTKSERAKKDEKKAAAVSQEDAAAAEPEDGSALRKQLADLRVSYPGRVLIFRTEKEGIVYEEDAKYFQKLFQIEPKTWPDGQLKFCGFKIARMEEIQDKLKKAKKKFAVVHYDAENDLVSVSET